MLKNNILDPLFLLDQLMLNWDINEENERNNIFVVFIFSPYMFIMFRHKLHDADAKSYYVKNNDANMFMTD